MSNKNVRNAYYASVLEKPLKISKSSLKIKTERDTVSDYNRSLKLSKSSIKGSCKLKNVNILKQLKQFQDSQHKSGSKKSGCKKNPYFSKNSNIKLGMSLSCHF